jgi:hypothetical protein
MTEERTVKMFKNTAEGNRTVGKSRVRFLDEVENDLKMGVRSWRKIAKVGDT